jgi:ElaB/YqjD/DUF883 family membrane-anchored ribosome-binding protein
MAATGKPQGNFQNQGTSGSQTGQQFGQTANRLGQEALEKGREAGAAVKEQAQNLSERAKDMASNVAEKARDVAANVGERTDDAFSSVGERISNWGSSLREAAPREGMIGSAAQTVAGQLETGGHYIQEHGLSGIAEDVTAVIRRNPITALCVGFSLGCVIGMALSSRR